MRTKETKVYLYSELSDEAKERARAWCREGQAQDDYFSEGVIDDAKEVLKVLGYRVGEVYYSGFASQGAGAQFTGSFYASDYDSKGTNGVQKMLIDRPTDKELARCAAELESILLLAPELSASIEHYGHYYHETANRISVYLGEFEGTATQYTDIEDSFKEVSRDLMRWIYASLEREYDHQVSDETIAETIEANGYEFTAEGYNV